MGRENEMTFFVFADEFYHAAQELEKVSNKNKVSMPSYYLYAHAIELAYKSYLFKCGVDLKYIKIEIGHDLEKALKEVKGHGFDKKLSDNPDYESVVIEINKYYVTKEFEYMTATAKKLPLLQNVKVTAKQTINASFDAINGYI